MSDSALRKIERASVHINELNALFEKRKPFRYVIRTDTNTGERTMFAKKDEPVIFSAGDIIADVVHNLRTALDQAYWAIVSPFALSKKDERAVQFPFSETAARLEEAVKNRLAERVSSKFFQALIDLKPHGENGGNELLYLVHALDGLDKHRTPIPTGDYKTIDTRQLLGQVPDIPFHGSFTASFTQIDVQWRNSNVNKAALGFAVPFANGIFEKELNVPVQIVFSISLLGTPRPVIPTLNKLVDVTKTTIEIIRNSI